MPMFNNINQTKLSYAQLRLSWAAFNITFVKMQCIPNSEFIAVLCAEL